MIVKEYRNTDEEKENSNVANGISKNKLIGNISDIKGEKKKEIKDIKTNIFIDNNIENLIVKKEKEESLKNFINENIVNIVPEISKITIILKKGILLENSLMKM